METHEQETKPVLSASSSPAHEFSFTISLHSSTTKTPTTKPLSSSPSLAAKSKQQSPSAIDLSPADEIFFHGHLLPLHFLSHLHSSSPRPSTQSLDSFALPIRDLLQQEEKPLTTNFNTTYSTNCYNEDDEEEDEDDHCISFNKDVINHLHNDFPTQEIHQGLTSNNNNNNNNNKAKSFSLFGLSKWKKANNNSSENKEKLEGNGNSNNKRKVLKFDVSQIVKRYIKMVKPLLSRRENIRERRQSYSFSGTATPRDNSNKRELMMMRGRRGEFSAPASMRTSPTNSGLLLATSGLPSPVSDSTMEELQSAIQAAIAHCKNSISHDLSSSSSSSLPVN